MKKNFWVLPACVVFAFCSSSKKATTPVTPGISNVNVSSNNNTTRIAQDSARNASDKDFAYTASHDTTLNGTWVLDGMTGADGNWSTMQNVDQDSSATTTDSAMVVSDTTATTAGTTTATTETTTKGRGGKGKLKNKRKALYDSAQARLNLDYKSPSTLDTTSQPYKYWSRVPSVTLNANNLIFTGTTGCNSMSGSFNFSSKDIQFGRNIVTSKMSCNEYDETRFLSALKKADNYSINGNTLQLKQGQTLLLSFKKA